MPRGRRRDGRVEPLHLAEPGPRRPEMAGVNRASLVVVGQVAMPRPVGRGLDADAIVAAVVPELRSGDVVAILSNGGFGGIHQKLLRALA